MLRCAKLPLVGDCYMLNTACCLCSCCGCTMMRGHRWYSVK